MVTYILSTFHSQDEEIEIVHLPVIFTADVEMLAVIFSCSRPGVAALSM